MSRALGVVIAAVALAGGTALVQRAKERRRALPRRAASPAPLGPRELPEGWTRYTAPVPPVLRTAAELVLRADPPLGSLQTIALDGLEFGAFIERRGGVKGVSLLVRA